MATLTANKNYLSPTGFHLKINSLRFPNLEYFATTITLPQITLEEQALPYKTVDYAAPGTRLSFSDLSITAQITENFDNYLETFNWMHSIAASKGKDVEDLKEDATLMVFTSHNNVNKTIRFKDIFPTGIGSLEFSSTATEINYLSTEITFSYTNFEFE